MSFFSILLVLYLGYEIAFSNISMGGELGNETNTDLLESSVLVQQFSSRSGTMILLTIIRILGQKVGQKPEKLMLLSFCGYLGEIESKKKQQIFNTLFSLHVQ